MLDTKGFVQDETGTWWKQATNQRHKGAELNCERCGKQFITYVTQRKRQRFCSPECIHEARQRRKQFTCTRCGAPVERRAARDKRTKSDNVFCSRTCHYEWRKEETDRSRAKLLVCPTCGKEFEKRTRYPSQKQTYCSRECAVRDPNGSQMAGHVKTRGENSYRWKGGYITRRGYRMRLVPDHPTCQGNQRQYVAEHRLVMEEHLGRYLDRHEVVHHKNGDKLDNRIENLELWEHGHPAGQRVEEKPHCPTCTCFRE